MSDFLKKYHVYLVALIAFLTVAFQVATGIAVPEFVYSLEAAIGLGSIRIQMAQVGSTTGWKTYALATALGVTAALRAFGISIPLEVDATIAALATATLGAGVKKIA